ncbi:hypothetical protein Dda_2482 [Drechslerella dactyloides]|uniref:Maintenance of telomere capping protein 1 n=1 Tax=Drechslerella dactyloides TaxID=74499 RepID=A0AAD6NKD7_DREDA|nr:hypothetical protein Dda_2482 [Drechslerella dactyloides]
MSVARSGGYTAPRLIRLPVPAATPPPAQPRSLATRSSNPRQLRPALSISTLSTNVSTSFISAMPPKKAGGKPAVKVSSATPSVSKNTDIDSLFAGIDDISTSNPPPADAKPRASLSADAADADEKALLAEIEGLTAEHRAPSRPVTPRLAAAAAGSNAKASSESLRKKAAASRAPVAAAPAAKAATVESDDDEEDDDDDDEDEDDEEEDEEDGEELNEKQTKPKSSTKASAAQAEGQASGGWWGGIWSTASAAASVAQNTASNVYKEIQASEEAQRWTRQVKGSVEGFKELGGELQKRAIPTFTTLLHHIAPPISAHERLHIHTTHDLQNYPSIDPIIHHVFARVMQQVEGGDLLVIQRGSEATNKHNSTLSSGWGGGPWWRDERKRELGAVKGLEAGVKLAKATAEGFASEYAQRSPSLERKTFDPNNPVRKSDIFLSLQPVVYPCPFTTATLKPEDTEDGTEVEEVMSFAVHLLDPTHALEFTTMSQTCPAKWGDWMDAEFEELPEDVQVGLANGAVDPREWISEWMEETIALAVGMIAQRYVSRRMGVGEGLGKGKEVDLEGRQEANFSRMMLISMFISACTITAILATSSPSKSTKSLLPSPVTPNSHPSQNTRRTHHPLTISNPQVISDAQKVSSNV